MLYSHMFSIIMPAAHLSTQSLVTKKNDKFTNWGPVMITDEWKKINTSHQGEDKTGNSKAVVRFFKK